MENSCFYENCLSRVEISCVCQLREKYFCVNHFMVHRKEFPTVRHVFSDIWPEDQEANEICEVCTLNPPGFVCLCQGRSNLLCSGCLSIHSKIGISHSLEPLNVVQFVKDSSVADYLNRKSKVQRLSEFITLNKEKCKGFKNQILQVFQETCRKLEENKENALKELQNIEKDLDSLSEKISRAQFEFRLDLSDKIFRIIEENDFQGIEKTLKNLEIFTVSFNSDGLKALDKSFVDVKNQIGGFLNDHLKIYEYFEKNQQKMPDCLKELFREALDGVERDRVYLNVDYKYLAQDLALVIGLFKNLKSLDISKTGLGSAGCKILFGSTDSLNQLTEINIGENYILDEGCKYFCNSLKSFPVLESLFLHKNALTEISGQLLSLTLTSNPKLKVLSLNQNSLSDEGSIYLSDVLTSLNSFEALGLQKNQLSSKCIPGICNLLDLQSLQDLSLDDNEIDDEGSVLLKSKLPSRATPLKLYIRNNRLSEKQQEQLRQANPLKVAVITRYSY